jgi:hypothetical protein
MLIGLCLVRRATFGCTEDNKAPVVSVVSSQPARPAALGCVGLIKKPGWLFGLL